MRGPHSDQTKKKISQGVKKAIARKAKSKIKERYSSFFASGHPDGIIPSAVRSSGDLVKEQGTSPGTHKRAGLETHEEKLTRVNDLTNILGLRRAKNVRKENEGQAGGAIVRFDFDEEMK